VRVWIGQAVSQAGDWISYVALLAMVLELTRSGWSVSVLLALSTVMTLIVTPLTGVVADRMDRRRVLIGADLVRMAATCGLLLVHDPRDLWLVFAITAINVAASNFFAPAAAAALPNLVGPHQLAAANSLMGATSGIMMALGAAAGGIVAGLWGRPTAFVVDAASFLVSALTIAAIRVPLSAPREGDAGPVDAGADVVEGLRYVFRQRTVLAVILLKLGTGLAGGVLTLLSIVPVQVLRAGDRGVGVLYCSRGLGTIVGSLAGPLGVGDETRERAARAATGLVTAGLFCVGFGFAPTLGWATAAVFVVYLGVSALFVLTTAALQQEVADRLRGRVFALDNGAMMAASTISTLACGWGVVSQGPRAVALAAGLLQVVFGLGWLAWYRLLKPLEEGTPE
jgi:predicted MFS family arabinose efflux permease